MRTIRHPRRACESCGRHGRPCNNLSLCERFSLCASPALERAALHHRRGPRSRHRDWGQHRHLQCGQCGPPQAAPFPQPEQLVAFGSVDRSARRTRTDSIRSVIPITSISGRRTRVSPISQSISKVRPRPHGKGRAKSAQRDGHGRISSTSSGCARSSAAPSSRGGKSRRRPGGLTAVLTHGFGQRHFKGDPRHRWQIR